MKDRCAILHIYLHLKRTSTTVYILIQLNTCFAVNQALKFRGSVLRCVKNIYSKMCISMRSVIIFETLALIEYDKKKLNIFLEKYVTNHSIITFYSLK